MNRKQPFKAVGVLAAILISPRNFLYTNCEKCERTLYYTYAGESCPFCGTVVTDFQRGQLPKTENGNGRGKQSFDLRDKAYFSEASGKTWLKERRRRQ